MSINNNTDYSNALKRLDDIWGAKPEDTNWDERCSLIEQIIKYEDVNFYIPPPDPIDAILFRMEQGGLNTKDLVPFIGTEEKVLEVLSRQTELSKDMVIKLKDGLGISLDSLTKEKEK